MKYMTGKVSKEESEKIKEATGLEVKDYQHIVDNYGVKHPLSILVIKRKKKNVGRLQ